MLSLSRSSGRHTPQNVAELKRPPDRLSMTSVPSIRSVDFAPAPSIADSCREYCASKNSFGVSVAV